jgi:hypothetical protein
MRRPQRLIAAAVLIAFSGALAGCSSGFGSSSFDPSDLLDFLDTKKKLPGDRKPVFPDGVPGLEQGVPKDLYKGAQQDQQQQQNASVAPAAPAAPPPEEPKPMQASKSKAKGKQPAATAAAPAPADPAAEPNGEAVPEEDATQAAPPPPKPAKKLVRRRTTAPPPDQSQGGQSAQSQQSPAAFPAPLPAGTFTR